MADVPTAVTGIPVQTLLATQPSDNSILPRAVIRFAQAATMPALGAGDVNIMTFTGVLPPNYAYQVRDLRIGIFGPNEVDVDHVEAGSFYPESRRSMELHPSGIPVSGAGCVSSGTSIRPCLKRIG